MAAFLENAGSCRTGHPVGVRVPPSAITTTKGNLGSRQTPSFREIGPCGSMWLAGANGGHGATRDGFQGKARPCQAIAGMALGARLRDARHHLEGLLLFPCGALQVQVGELGTGFLQVPVGRTASGPS